jgi:hypothetical protein
MFNPASGKQELVAGVHIGNATISSDAGYEPVLSWLQSQGFRNKAREFQKAKLVLSNPNALHMKKMLQDPPKSRTEWRFMLLYSVKEGVLVYLADDRESCERVVKDVAVMYGITTHPPGRTSLVTGTSIVPAYTGERDSADEAAKSAEKIRKDAEDRVKSGELPVGNVTKGTACYKLSNIVIAELGRRFAVRCEPEEQSECTNCVMFCMRVIVSMKLTLRGYHLRHLCEHRADLGKKAGDAVDLAWEQLWSRSGANTSAGFDSQVARTTNSRWLDALHTTSTREEPQRLLHAWRGLPKQRLPALIHFPANLTGSSTS